MIITQSSLLDNSYKLFAIVRSWTKVSLYFFFIYVVYLLHVSLVWVSYSVFPAIASFLVRLMLVSVVFFFSSNHTHMQPKPRLSSSKIMSWRYHLKLIKITVKNTNGFSDLISDAVFGLSYLTYLGSGFSSIWAAITHLHWSRIAAKRQFYWEECATNQLKYRRDP